MELVKINPEEFGLQEKQVETIEAAFMPKITEREGLAVIYKQLITNELTPELCSEAKALRSKLVKVRTGIAEIHKTQKAYFLAAGRFVDAWKNKETEPVTQMEEKLMDIEKYYERIEAEKIAKLQEERAAEISAYSEEGSFIPPNLGELTDEVYANFLLGTKTAYELRKKAEQEAIEAERKRIEAEKAEQERIRLENEKLKKEAEEHEKAAKLEAEKRAKERAAREAKAEAERKQREEKERKEREAHEAELRKEREEREKIQAELEAKAEAERKQREALAVLEQAELAKGDADKVKDLIKELDLLKTSYSFKSKKNQVLYSQVGQLLDKVVNHIKTN